MATTGGKKWRDPAENLCFYHLRSKNFGLDRDKTLDLPLSAETLAELAYILGPLRGIEPPALAEEIADLETKGLPILPK